MAKRTARDFSRRLIAKIAIIYAGTDASYSAEYFSREYEISETTFYTLLRKAVIENIVSTDVVNAMKNKAECAVKFALNIKKRYDSAHISAYAAQAEMWALSYRFFIFSVKLTTG